jgi:mRNA interferase RelE/StbE
MKVEFRKSFEKDLRKLRDPNTLIQIQAVIESIEQAENLSILTSVKKLEAEKSYYRIRVGDYRIGIIFDEDVVIFV